MTNDDVTKRRWARPNMTVAFRAEIMPGKLRDERSYRVVEVLRNQRVRLENFPGEYREAVFEPVNNFPDRGRPDQN
jgi:hypothetical protein